MTTIRVIYHPVLVDKVLTPRQPNFPATDQHPNAVRYLVGLHYVDAIGGQPTQAEIDAVLAPPPAQPTLEEKVAALQAAAGISDLDVLASTPVKLA